MQLNAKAETWRHIKRYKRQPVVHPEKRTAPSNIAHRVLTFLLHRDVMKREATDSSDTEMFSPHSDLYYSCQMLRQSSTAMKTVWGFLILGFFPFQAISITEMDHHRLECCHSAFALTTSDLPSSGPAEAPSESIPCSSPVSELFSRPPDCAPSVRHPLEFDLEKEFRKQKKKNPR